MSYDFIIDDMTWSFSRANGFKNCPYAWRSTYIYKEPTLGNCFGEFGTFCHLVLEKYFGNEITKDEMPIYFKKHYRENVKIQWPKFPPGMEAKRYDAVLNFLKDFPFNREEWDVVAIEEEIFTEIEGYKVIIKPDLRLKHKNKNKMVIIDYKTSTITQDGEIDKAKKQISFYALGVLLNSGDIVNEGQIWFLRFNQIVEFKITSKERLAAKNWFIDEIHKIEQEEKWEKTPNEYFCKNLCGSRKNCNKAIDKQ